MIDGIPPRFQALVRLLLIPPTPGTRAGGADSAPRNGHRADTAELGRATGDEIIDLVASSLRDARPSRRIAAIGLLREAEHLPRAAELVPLLREAVRDAPPSARAEAEAWVQRIATEQQRPLASAPQPLGADGDRLPDPRGLAPASSTQPRPLTFRDSAEQGSHPLREEDAHPMPSPYAPPHATTLAALDWIRRIPPTGRTAGIAAIVIYVAARLLLG